LLHYLIHQLFVLCPRGSLGLHHFLYHRAMGPWRG
jgi:hypothetical protein